MLTKEEMPACPVATTVELIGSKWKLLIIRNFATPSLCVTLCGSSCRSVHAQIFTIV